MTAFFCVRNPIYCAKSVISDCGAVEISPVISLCSSTLNMWATLTYLQKVGAFVLNFDCKATNIDSWLDSVSVL